MLAYVKTKTRLFQPSLDFTILEVESMNALKCRFQLKYKGNWQDWGFKVERRRDFMYELIKILKELDITYSRPSEKKEGVHEQRKNILHSMKADGDEVGL
jgi:hypothetical protein